MGRDEDFRPAPHGEITEIASDTRDEVVVYRMPIRLPDRVGQRSLVVRAFTATAVVTLAVE